MCNSKIIFLFHNQSICFGYSKEPSQCNGSYEHPKHMSKITEKKVFTIFTLKNFVYQSLWMAHGRQVTLFCFLSFYAKNCKNLLVILFISQPNHMLKLWVRKYSQFNVENFCLSCPMIIAINCLIFNDCRNLFIILFISQPKHMLWVLKRTVSMRRVF